VKYGGSMIPSARRASTPFAGCKPSLVKGRAGEGFAVVEQEQRSNADRTAAPPPSIPPSQGGSPPLDALKAFVQHYFQEDIEK
jgi:hypothetical protein